MHRWRQFARACETSKRATCLWGILDRCGILPDSQQDHVTDGLVAVQPQRVNIKSDIIHRVVEIAVVALLSGTLLGYSGDSTHPTEEIKRPAALPGLLWNQLHCPAGYQPWNEKLFGRSSDRSNATASSCWCVIDNDLLWVSGEPKEIWCRKDFASNSLILKATSHKTMMGVLQASNEECGSKAMFVLTLTFIMRVFLFSVHGEEVDWLQAMCDWYLGSNAGLDKHREFEPDHQTEFDGMCSSRCCLCCLPCWCHQHVGHLWRTSQAHVCWHTWLLQDVHRPSWYSISW